MDASQLRDECEAKAAAAAAQRADERNKQQEKEKKKEKWRGGKMRIVRNSRECWDCEGSSRRPLILGRIENGESEGEATILERFSEQRDDNSLFFGGGGFCRLSVMRRTGGEWPELNLYLRICLVHVCSM